MTKEQGVEYHEVVTFERKKIYALYDNFKKPKMTKEKTLFILHCSPPIHGASKAGDSILTSAKIKEELTSKFIKIKSSKTIDEVGLFRMLKMVYFLELFIKVGLALIFFRPKIVYYTPSPAGFAFYRDLVVSLPIKFYRLFCKSTMFYHYHSRGINKFVTKSPTNRKLTNFLLKGSSIILGSKILKFESEQLTSPNHVFYLNNGVVDQLTNEAFEVIVRARLSDSTLRLLFLSNLMKEKGYDVVLDIAKTMKSNGYKDVKIDFAGSWGSQEDEIYFNEYVSAHQLDHIVTYHGLVSGKKMDELFRASKIFIFPSTYRKEVFPLSILEALSYGVPVLAFDIAAVSEIINPKTGILTTKERIFEDLKTMINNVGNEDAYYSSRNVYLQQYGVDVFIDRLLEILKSK